MEERGRVLALEMSSSRANPTLGSFVWIPRLSTVPMACEHRLLASCEFEIARREGCSVSFNIEVRIGEAT